MESGAGEPALRALDILRISPTTINNRMHARPHHADSLWRHVRQGHCQRRRRLGSLPRPSLRGPSIRLRPRGGGASDQAGQWEVDTVVGTNRECGVATAVERVTGLGAACYFSDPDRAWQRGINENTNGRIRR